MSGKIAFLFLLLSYIVYMESAASSVPLNGGPSSSVDSANKAKATNYDITEIVVANGGGTNYPKSCNDKGLLGISKTFISGNRCD